MSREIKYIGMDVHQEAVVIAVRNSTGELVMESIIETKASSLVHFIHGLRGRRSFCAHIDFAVYCQSICGKAGLRLRAIAR